MSFLSDGFNWVADKVEGAADATGSVLGDILETVGNGVQDGANWLGDAASHIPGIGGALSGVVSWVGGIVSSAFGIIGAVFKGVLDFAGGLIGGIVRVAGGIVGWKFSSIVQGFEDILGNFVGAVLVIVGKAVSFVQSVLALESKRRLSDDEDKLLRRVFHESIALYNVRIDEGFAGIFSATSRPFTLGNTIYIKSFKDRKDVLVHEATHVWQYQHLGVRYASEALGCQVAYGVANAYNWRREIEDGHDEWQKFNREAEGRFFEDLYTDGDLLEGKMLVTHGDGAFYDADGTVKVGRFVVANTNYTDRANKAVEYVRGSSSKQLSGLWS